MIRSFNRLIAGYPLLNAERIGLEEVQDGLWNIVYYNVLLGRFDERTKTITGAPQSKK